MKIKKAIYLTSSILVTLVANAKTGEQIYNETCVSCHGAKGDGDSPTGKALKATNFTKGFNKNTNKLPAEDYIVKVIQNGVPGTAMTSYAGVMKDVKEQEDVAKYIATKFMKK